MYESRSEMRGMTLDSFQVTVYWLSPERTSPPAGYVMRTSAATTPKNETVRRSSIMFHKVLLGTQSVFRQLAISNSNYQITELNLKAKKRDNWENIGHDSS